MGDERGRARALSQGARGGTPRKEKTGAEGTGCGALARKSSARGSPLARKQRLARAGAFRLKRDADTPVGAYGPDSDIVDFILGITFEIWEQRGVELIHRYYAPNVEVYGMEGVIHGAQAMVDGTRQMLEAFPDRLLLGDNVVWSGNRESGFYSSHRITSPMTNRGPSAFGEATGRRVCITNVADCVVENGVVTREWLMRDNLALVRQLGFDPAEAARRLAARMGPDDRDWMAREAERVAQAEPLTVVAQREGAASDSNGTRLAAEFLATQWGSASEPTRWDCYAPYAVLHRSPVERYSGRDAIAGHYADLRRAFGDPWVSLDHVACQPFGSGGLDVAARWTAAGSHADTFAGTAATGEPLYILGVSHWRTAAGRIVAEWTVFDQLAVLGQILDKQRSAIAACEAFC